MTISEQIHRLQKIEEIIKAADRHISWITAISLIIRRTPHDQGTIIEAHKLLQPCPEHCGCPVHRAIDPILWRHLVIKYGCDETSRYRIKREWLKALEELREAVEAKPTKRRKENAVRG